MMEKRGVTAGKITTGMICSKCHQPSNSVNSKGICVKCENKSKDDEK